MYLPPPVAPVVTDAKEIKISTEKSGHFYWLDLIRFVAALLVVAGHYRQEFFPAYNDLPLGQQGLFSSIFYASTRMGYEAVLVFFVLSGFLVGGKALDRMLSGSFRPLDYSIDRAVRIMLPLISALLIYLPVCLLDGTPVVAWDWIGSLLSLQCIFCTPPIGVLWSLSYEVWFYILMASIGYIVVNRGRVKSVFGMFVLLISFMVFTKLSFIDLFIWLIGAAGYFMLSYRSKSIMFICLVVSVIMLGLLQFSQESNVIDGMVASQRIRNFYVLAFAMTFTCFLVQVIQYAPTHKWSINLNKIGTRLAAFSYTLYLTHIPVQKYMAYFGIGQMSEFGFVPLLLYIVYILVALMAAYCIYWLFERNTSLVKGIIRKKLQL